MIYLPSVPFFNYKKKKKVKEIIKDNNIKGHLGMLTLDGNNNKIPFLILFILRSHFYFLIERIFVSE